MYKDLFAVALWIKAERDCKVLFPETLTDGSTYIMGKLTQIKG